uniref:Glycosyl transferase 64 domain-containing protein n=1 Tax=Timema bartmani TaxID=61472 RepID=A0A7R9F3H5_9NEOP|nr:unnamed protein product [Timema bartmani]
MLGNKPGEQFTAIIYSQLGSSTMNTAPLFRLVRNVAHSQYVARIVVIWSGEKSPPAKSRWPILPVSLPLNVLQNPSNTNGDVLLQAHSISQRFYPHSLIQTDSVLSLDEDCLLTTDEVDFAFQVWVSFPDRIVGYPARSHYWDDAKGSWGYTSKWTNDYSIVLTGAAFYHRYYNFLYTHWLSPLLHKTVEQSQNCEDILMNFLVSHVTRRPPVKVTQRKQYKEQPPGGARLRLAIAAAMFWLTECTSIMDKDEGRRGRENIEQKKINLQDCWKPQGRGKDISGDCNGVATEERLEQSLQGGMAQTGKGGRNELEVENVYFQAKLKSMKKLF